MSSDLAIISFIFPVLLIYYSIANSFRYKSYINPDPFGHAAVVAGLKEYGSFSQIIKNWEIETGQDFNFYFDWNVPTENLESPWNVSNESIKYAADSIYFQRTGLSAFMSRFDFGASSYEIFAIAWNSIGILILSIIVVLLYKINKSLFKSPLKPENLNYKVKNNSHRISWSSVAILAILFIFITNSLGFNTFLLEGFVPHLMSFMLLLLAIAIFGASPVKNSSKFNITVFFLIYAGMYLVYLQMIPILLFVFGTLVILRFITEKRRPHLRQIFKGTFALVPLLTIQLNLPGVKYLIGSVSGVSGHGSLHLGLPTTADLLGTLPAKVLLNKPVPNMNKVIFSNDSYSISTQQWGYVPIENSSIIIIAMLFLFLFLTGLSLYVFKASAISRLLGTVSILLIGYNLYYFISSTFFANESRILSDYIWLRLSMLSVLMVLCWLPALIVKIFSGVHQLSLKVVSFLLVTVLLCFGYFNSTNFLLSFSKNSQPFTDRKSVV
jgi:hypothetical protein